jgi:hypothetical protein
MKKLGIIQPGRLGDLIICLPIANFYYERGYRVFWPIFHKFVPMMVEAAPHIDFKPTTDDVYHCVPQARNMLYRCDEILDLAATFPGSQITEQYVKEGDGFGRERFDEFKFNRQKIWNFYNLELKKNPYLKLPAKKDFVDPFWHLYSLRIPHKLRLDFFNHMRRNDINVQVNYFPVHLQPVFQSSKSISNLNNSIEYYNGAISLPIYSELNSSQQIQIVEVINKFRFDV